MSFIVVALLAGVSPLVHADQADVAPEAPSATVRRVRAPYDVSEDEAAIFWFGRITLSENYTDARVRYTDDGLFLRLGIIDRLLWYDKSPSPTELIAWDSVSLYLSRSGDVGEVPDTDSYRFDAQLDPREPDRADFRAAYQGDGSGWVAATVPFTTSAGWMGNAPNDGVDDRGWMLTYTIPFTSLGLDGPPPQGTVWGLGLAVHDRDSDAGPPLEDQLWPVTTDPLRPVTWGQLIFGLKPSYTPGPALPQATAVIRHGLSDVEVIDADVGGSSTCGDPAHPDFFPAWGDLNYAGKEFLNIQHVGPISEWPCYSKYYVTFPLDSLPEGKVVLSATLTLYQFGNAGEGHDPGPQPSFIEVFTVDEDWEESSLTWNNAPLAGDYVAASWVDPLDESPPSPGIPRHWDVSGAVAEARAAGEPLMLALHSTDWPKHGGKYFYSSDIGGAGEGRPTLTVSWGSAVPSLNKTARPTSGVHSDVITYTLGIHGDGGSLVLTDTLPPELDAPIMLAWEGTSVRPTYDSGRLTWSDSPTAGQPVTLTYSARIGVQAPATLVNIAVLIGADGIEHDASATVMANPCRIALPLIMKRG